MKNTIVVGCAFGDEAKAKIVDRLSSSHDVVIRFNGGANAGHTIKFGDTKFVSHLIPAGIFNENNICIIAPGVVLDFKQFEKEMKELESLGVNLKNRLFLDERVNVILSTHIDRDKEYESKKYGERVGTTGRGIGPCYADIANRISLRLGDLKDTNKIHQMLFNQENINNFKNYNEKEITDDLTKFYQSIKSKLINTPYFLEEYSKTIGREISVLFEGSQAALLDINFGTYPYVTSSHTLSSGALAYTGFPITKITDVVGVLKSYYTRVGQGPFVTELDNEVGEYIRKKGNEYGSTTGRPRRCGWFDLVAAKYAIMINGVTEINLMLLDVLSGLDEIKVCEYYAYDGEIIDKFPTDTSILSKVRPVYKTFKGWSEDISNVRKWCDLPKECKEYVFYLNKTLKTKITMLSVGPDRDQVIELEWKDQLGMFIDEISNRINNEDLKGTASYIK